MGGWLENWRVIPISAFNYVIVEVVAEIGNIADIEFLWWGGGVCRDILLLNPSLC